MDNMNSFHVDQIQHEYPLNDMEDHFASQSY